MKKHLIATALAVFTLNASAFTLHTSESCAGKYNYYISEYASYPDVSVKVSEYASYPDITIKLVNSKYGADIVVTDTSYGADMDVCKASSRSGARTIKVSEYTSYPDITVKVSEYASYPDYTMYFDSTVFTLEEAAALVPAIWHLNKK